MIKGNKGVTLVELLIVIVVMGIIATFSIVSVRKIIENTKKDRVYADALMVAEAVTLYCISDGCEPKEGATNTHVKWKHIKMYIDGIDEEYYNLPDGFLVSIVQAGEIESPRVRLRAIDPTDYSWYIFRDPSDPDNDRDNVTTRE